jgi:hypothetical protein
MAEPSEISLPCPRCAVLERRIAELEARIGELERLLLEATRASKRQAAPFSRNRPKKNPQKPGRPEGHEAALRPAPPQITETIDVRLEHCPDCGGPVENMHTHQQVVTDLPEIKPVAKQYVTHSGYCPRCRKRVRSRHPEQSSDAAGSAGNQIGPTALALAADLKHRLGLSYRKIVELFDSRFGLRLSAGALARAGQRLARFAAGTYQRLIQVVQASPVVYADETGWRVSARSAWLWVFTNRFVTVYVIRAERGAAVIREVLGDFFTGVLSSDCCASYDPIAVDKQKCLGHILKDLSVIGSMKSWATARFSREASAVLKDAIDLKRRSAELSTHGYASARGRIEARTDRLLERNYRDGDNQRLANRMIKHRDHLFTFLYHQGVEPTNNAAERALRPAVISRKLSAGNRSPTGATTHGILASLAQTTRQNGCDFVAVLTTILCKRDPAYIEPLIPVLA